MPSLREWARDTRELLSARDGVGDGDGGCSEARGKLPSFDEVTHAFWLERTRNCVDRCVGAYAKEVLETPFDRPTHSQKVQNVSTVAFYA